ncbi:growth hormone-inducible transmembrane protein [Scaptodrosophila lebanonensis]|uniref:Growth hormone-inducible transmembrane protein n=1 Tax=Drosophila lebanonensis TaxID=7225 RepID=A0A6J2TEN6_DROLE|nr:growth hormone-inducible transmembrane protein [Scaptodrosophila lebanonensis]
MLARLTRVLPAHSTHLLKQSPQRLWSSTSGRTLLQQQPKYEAKSLLLTLRSKPPSLNTRDYSRDSRGRDRTHLGQRTGPSMKERLMGPPGENAYSMGKGAAGGAALMGLVALCYYGLGLSKQPSLYDHSVLWPQYVKDRIHATYAYFGASCAITAASALAVFQSDALLGLLMRSGWVSTLVTLGVVMATGAVAQAIDYEPGFGAKQLAWALHCGVLGAVIAPMCFLGGPILTRALLYTGGIVGALSTVAACAPSDKFLYMGGPLAIGLGVIFASSLASMWLPPTTAVGAGLASMSLYGGLILFSGFLLYDTQRIVHNAELHPEHSKVRYDPINNALAIYMDALNIFIRIAIILAGDQQGRKR